MRKGKYRVSAQMDLLFSEGDKKPLCVRERKYSEERSEVRDRNDEKEGSVLGWVEIPFE